MSMQVIEHIEVGSGGTTEIEFAAIPATYTDLRLVLSLRTNTSGGGALAQYRLLLNDSTTNYSERVLYGIPTTTGSSTATATEFRFNYMTTADATASTFSNNELYIPNYASSNAKSASFSGVTEDNTTSGAIAALTAQLWNDTTAVSSIQIKTFVDSFVQYSSATLYGVTAGSDGTTTVS